MAAAAGSNQQPTATTHCWSGTRWSSASLTGRRRRTDSRTASTPTIWSRAAFSAWPRRGTATTPTRGVAFEAFAIPRVKGAIIDAIRASDWVPRKARQKARETGEPVACS